MQYKSFFKDLYEAAAQEKLQNEQYPYGGFDVSDSDAQLMNTNELSGAFRIGYRVAALDNAGKHLNAAGANIGGDAENKKKFDYHVAKVNKRTKGIEAAKYSSGTRPKTESIFMKMMAAKKDAQKPLASKKPISEPPSAKPKIQPEPKVYSVSKGPTTPDEFRELIARARQKKQNTEG